MHTFRVIQLKEALDSIVKWVEGESVDIRVCIKVTDNEDAIQQELFDNLIEIGFENVMLSQETWEVATPISCYIAKGLLKKFGHRCKNYCISESKTASTTHAYIDLLSRARLTLPSECLGTYVCDCFAVISHALNVIISSKIEEYLLNVVMFHEPCYALCTAVQGKAWHIR